MDFLTSTINSVNFFCFKCRENFTIKILETNGKQIHQYLVSFEIDSGQFMRLSFEPKFDDGTNLVQFFTCFVLLSLQYACYSNAVFFKHGVFSNWLPICHLLFPILTSIINRQTFNRIFAALLNSLIIHLYEKKKLFNPNLHRNKHFEIFA